MHPHMQAEEALGALKLADLTTGTVAKFALDSGLLLGKDHDELSIAQIFV